MSQDLRLIRPPQSDDELHALVEHLWGVRIPTTVHPDCVDKGHCAPFEWFSDAFFGRAPRAISMGSRGLSGKTFAMATLGLTAAVVLGANVLIAAGSTSQTKQSIKHMQKFWSYKNAPSYMLKDDLASEMRLTNGAIITSVTSSERGLRSAHPQWLLIDEIDEWGQGRGDEGFTLLESAQGMPMDDPNWLGVSIPAQVAGTSTLQRVDGPFRRLMDQMDETGERLYSWCYKESSIENGGWLTEDLINKKRSTLSQDRWCIAKGTLVTTTRGPVPIEHVAAGDTVLTRAGWRNVLRNWDHGVKEVVRVTCEGGDEIVCTPDHKLVSELGWTEAQDLTPSSRLFSQTLVESPTLLTDIRNIAASAVSDEFIHTMPILTPIPGSAGSIISSFNVFSESKKLQVSGVNTEVNSALVLDCEALRDISDKDSIRDAVRVSLLRHNLELAGSVLGNTSDFSSHNSLPDPASVSIAGTSLLDVITDICVTTMLGEATGGVFRPVLIVARTASESFLVSSYDSAVNTGILIGFHNVQSISHSGTTQVFDLSVEGNAEYHLSMGALAHNSREYELNEVSADHLAINDEAVDKMFKDRNNMWIEVQEDDIVKKKGKKYEEYFFESYSRNEDYVISADWARVKDYSVITVWKMSDTPCELVYYVRMKDVDWPDQVNKFNALRKQYGNCAAIHDATGIGDVVGAFFEDTHDVWDFKMAGEKRTTMLNDFIVAVEQGKLRAPKIDSLYRSLRYTTHDDVFSSGTKYHLPDEFCSAALAWAVMEEKFPAALPVGLPKVESNYISKGLEQNKIPTDKMHKHKSEHDDHDSWDLLGGYSSSGYSSMSLERF